MIVTSAALFYLVCATAATGERFDPFAGAVEVLRASFEPDEDRDYDGQPDDWSRRTGEAFPPYVEAAIDPGRGAHGTHSLHIRANGGPAVLYSPPVPIDALHSYVVQGAIRTQRLQTDAALISVSLLDHRMRRVQRFVTRPVSGTHRGWVRVRLGPLVPHAEVRYVVFGCHLVAGERAGVMGGAWFDDLWLGKLPQLSLLSQFSTQFVQRSAPMRIEARASGLDAGHEYRLDLQMIDSTGQAVEQQSFPLATDSTAGDPDAIGPPAVPPALVWDVPPRAHGFYRIAATLRRDGVAVLEKQTTLAVMDLVQGKSGGEFGWSLSAERDEILPRDLAEIAAQAGINWIKYPVWSSVHDPSADRTSRTVELFDLLNQRGIQPVGLLSDPPAALREKFARDWTGISEIFTMPPSFWAASLDPVMARYSSNVRHWQLGGDDDASFVGLSNLAELLTTVKGEFDRIGRDTYVGVHWNWDTPLPPGTRLPRAFVSVGGGESSSADEIAQKLRSLRGPEMPRWVLIRALPSAGHTVEQRGADLVRQMVAARIGGADAIFVTNVFHPDRGLLSPEGAPTLLFLPWRTTALALRQTQYLGSLTLPGGSRNFVFARDGEAVMVLWSDEPTIERLYLGEPDAVIATNIWGVQTRPTVDAESGRQAVRVGATPLVVRGGSEPVARWRMQVRFEQGRLRSATGQSQDVLIGRNTFPQGVTGEVRFRVPPEWEIEPRNARLQLGPGEEFRLPVAFSLPPYATLGTEQVALEFEIDADRKYRFDSLQPYQVGLGDVLIEVHDRRLPDGRLEIEQTVVNQTTPPEILSFECSLFIPGRKRQKAYVTKLGNGRNTKLYFAPDADTLRGQELWVRCEQVDGRRVLNYRWIVGKEWGQGAK